MPEAKPIVAIVPAAGLSRRFGGPNKLLQPWGDSTVVATTVNMLLGCGLPTIVVTGRDADQVASAVHPAQAVFNPRFEDGLSSSIAVGVSNAGACDGFLIALGDMPTLRADVVTTLIDAFNQSPNNIILAPVYKEEPDRPGHPVLFGSAYRKELEALTGDGGARSVVRAHREKLRLVPVEGHLADIDEAKDLD